MTGHHRVFRDRQQPDNRPVAYGYVRLEETDHDAIVEFRQNVAACCEREDLRLATTFCDLGDDGSTLARPALANLLEALKDTPSAKLVVPDLNHLSPYEVIRSALLLLLHRTEHQLLIATEPNGKLDDCGVTQHGVWIGEDDDAADEPA
jgi:DNA invertase Pin-like site-specific DNA recombinase